jgi:hypothetical protein
MIKLCPSKNNKNAVECKSETWHEPRKMKCILTPSGGFVRVKGQTFKIPSYIFTSGVEIIK